ncbi:MAG: hypothetical protein QOH60_1473 [Mycobacterium sp.]|nr:hypothetical protein [Mycobacterium sp.]
MASAGRDSSSRKRSPLRVVQDGVARIVISYRDASRRVLAQRAIVAGYVIAVAYVCARALFPGVGAALPRWIEWFGAPGNYVTVVVLLAFPLAYIIMGRTEGQRPVTGSPLFFLAVMAASAVLLGWSAYARCYGTPDPSNYDSETPFFAPLGWTLALFAGNVEDRFGPDSVAACQQVPIALEIARLLAIATTLTAGLAAALTLFRSQVDRFAIWRAHSVTVAVGVDDDTVSMIRAIANTLAPSETLVAVTKDDSTLAASAVRSLGAKVRVVNLDKPEAMARLRLWTRLQRLYLLSEDPVQNLMRFRVVDAHLEELDHDRIRLPLIVRIDDPWQAEVWRRSFLANVQRRWVADAVGRFELTAAKLVRHMTTRNPAEPEMDPPSTVVLCGLHPLTYALASELAQLERDQSLHAKPGVVPPRTVIIFADGARSFVEDHNMRQDRMAPDGKGLKVEPLECDPTVDAITAFARDDLSDLAVVLGDPSMETIATRLAARLPKLRVYAVSAVSSALADFSIVGHLYSFPVNMELERSAPQDVWERAAELVHEHFSAGRDRTKPSTRPWPQLSRFYRQSNRRQIHNALWMVETIAKHTWNSLETESADRLPPTFDAMEPIEQLEALGFDADTVYRMIQHEHEDWCRFYRESGWKYAPDRNDAKRHHPGLRPWAELAEDRSDFVDQARSSLVSVLLCLRSLGYRSVPKLAQQEAGGIIKDVV